LKAPKLVRDIARARPDVLFVSAYLDDGIALRRAIVRRHLPLLANIGTSSSFCMSDFGEALGKGAVGLFASDKPAAGALNLTGLSPDARRILVAARRAFRSRYHETMSAPALAGFSAAWALLKDVMPRASTLTPDGVAAAARQMHLPKGALPNGSGLQFGALGGPDASNNVSAESVIWEWTGVGHRSIVWPPRYATTNIKLFSTKR
jgi:ABC-type branched-subunit amino acid transport system substrate-binding protein